MSIQQSGFGGGGDLYTLELLDMLHPTEKHTDKWNK